MYLRRVARGPAISIPYWAKARTAEEVELARPWGARAHTVSPSARQVSSRCCGARTAAPTRGRCSSGGSSSQTGRGQPRSPERAHTELVATGAQRPGGADSERAASGPSLPPPATWARCPANRRTRTRMSGRVVGAGVSPAPTDQLTIAMGRPGSSSRSRSPRQRQSPGCPLPSTALIDSSAWSTASDRGAAASSGLTSVHQTNVVWSPLGTACIDEWWCAKPKGDSWIE